MKKLTRTIDVTITVYEDKRISFDFYENETGDHFGHYAKGFVNAATQASVGSELASWAELMLDEMEGGDDDD